LWGDDGINEIIPYNSLMRWQTPTQLGLMDIKIASTYGTVAFGNLTDCYGNLQV
jgi:hypothetical protein